MKDKVHKRQTLMNYSKEYLVDMVMSLEHNNQGLRKRFDIQYENCMNIVDDMNKLNENYKAAKRQMKDISEPYPVEEL